MEQYSPGLLPSHLQFGRNKDKANWFEEQQRLFMTRQMQEETNKQEMLMAEQQAKAQMGMAKYRGEILPAKLAEQAEGRDTKQYQAQIARIMKDRGVSAEEAQAFHSFLYSNTPQAQAPQGMAPEQEAKDRQEYIKMIMGQSRGVDETGNPLPGVSFKDASEQVDFMLRARREQAGVKGAVNNQSNTSVKMLPNGKKEYIFGNVQNNNGMNNGGVPMAGQETSQYPGPGNSGAGLMPQSNKFNATHNIAGMPAIGNQPIPAENAGVFGDASRFPSTPINQNNALSTFESVGSALKNWNKKRQAASEAIGDNAFTSGVKNRYGSLRDEIRSNLRKNYGQ